jgi:ATP phosphoribosyltransferase regulatory subunit HisZ
MTKAFLEPMVLKVENEKQILKAFSKKNLQKVALFNKEKKASLKNTIERKLSTNDLLLLS